MSKKLVLPRAFLGRERQVILYDGHCALGLPLDEAKRLARELIACAVAASKRGKSA